MIHSLKKFRVPIVASALLFAGASYTQLKQNKAADNPKVDKLKLQEGFKAEHLYSPSEDGKGSWVAMTFDNKGRMITSDQYGYLYRLTIPAINSGNTKPSIEKLSLGQDTTAIGGAQGLLYAFNSLYIVVNNRPSKKLPRTSGLYRLQDTNGDDQFDKITLLKELTGEGEHGPHSIILSPDKKSLYVVAGNFTTPPAMDSYRLPAVWQDDNLLPLIKDPRGHDDHPKVPAGWIANVDSTGKRWEMVAAGFRNPFDIAFNAAGDLFTYDSDMEWDFGLPWYRPTRICHVTSGAEFGWRIGTEKWSPSFADNLPAIMNIGQGSPTNVVHLKDAKFPAKYKESLLAFDWSFGIIHTINLKPSGSSYTAEREEFLSGMPLPLTDGAIGPDGALYFLTGGRRLESDLYRVYYNGTEATNVATATPINKDNALRRSLEKFHGAPNAAAITTAWPNLKHPDRFIRYAARIAVEHQPVTEWQAKALAEKDPVILTQAMIALARHGKSEQKNNILNALLGVNYKALSETQQLDLLRAYELVFLRMGKPDAAMTTKVVDALDAHYPAASNELNRGLSKLLVYLEAPKAVEKTITLLEKKDNSNEIAGGATATSSADLIMRNPQYGLDIAKMLEKVPPAQQTFYAIVLTQAKNNWTPDLQERYFKWFRNAFNYRGGFSYIGFIDRARKMALKNVPANKTAYFDKLSGAELLSKSGNDIVEGDYPKGPGKNWKVEDATKLFATELENRNFKQGKAMYSAITCNRCHSMQGEGGNVGPDLTQLGTRFSKKDILEAIIDPNKSVSDQYAATQFQLKNGQSIVGRLSNEDKDNYFVSQNPYSPDVLIKIAKKNVASTKASSVSIMLPGLINALNEEELKDLIAYLVAGGRENHPIFEAKK
ncbi:heme-binding protein [Emticicia oligotrophica DSM 17448]|uniref:Heme-binding protein n=1 Tax=Emticicia oligotrophica (strain DSM 17448 / CIP 109782 / MTCC 6937 / GPTSA100-15) TaxID=929562 RepID=A0ABM5MYZ8_EMTOG|nr:c-type cytochrome [Emticicia oligotrophica]AFK02398.1 heme-binding protein [Emticicia oligotrophica DSM 17448]